ncbi:hypothetical protein RB597_005613 [Gaeumannomyces tritici]
MSILPDTLNLYSPPKGGLPADAYERDEFWRNWGFTIYRTAYGGGGDGGKQSDQRWQTLLAKIREQAEDETRMHTDERLGATADAERAADRLRALFRLDAHSDAALLDGVSDDRLRELYRAGEPLGEDGKPPVMHDGVPKRRHFLVADAQVLEDAGNGRFWARCIQADYEPEDYVSRNPRWFIGQYYFGWMQMTTRSILELWSDLGTRDLDQIAPRSSDPERKDAVLYDGQLTGSGLH